jgi:PKHD-type hydroxylase
MNDYWEWRNCLTKEVCDTLIERFYKPDEENDARFGSNSDPLKDYAFRKTNICWIPKEELISIYLFTRALIANQKGKWLFDIDDYEQVQIAKYEQGGHYEWHKDEYFYDSQKSRHRKVSAIVFLSDPATYEGGDLLMHLGGEIKIESTLGSVICFPSEIMHKVTPVTEGVRYSLALWADGSSMK